MNVLSVLWLSQKSAAHGVGIKASLSISAAANNANSTAGAKTFLMPERAPSKLKAAQAANAAAAAAAGGGTTCSD
eukprot:COSAG05_NODE_1147_length_5730_cov_3.054520_6_plen_75_part_00